AKALGMGYSMFGLGVMRELGGLEACRCHLIKPGGFVGEMPPRQRVLTDSEIALVWQATQGEFRNGIESTYPAGPFARFLLLTAVRRSEAARMMWAEVNLGEALWIIPASHTKSGAPHEAPLSGTPVNP